MNYLVQATLDSINLLLTNNDELDEIVLVLRISDSTETRRLKGGGSKCVCMYILLMSQEDPAFFLWRLLA